VTPPVTAPEHWLVDFAEAQRVARRLARPMLVYVSPAPAGCPAARYLDGTLFTTANVKRLAARVVPVRLILDEATDDAASRALHDMDLLLTPAVVVLSPAGDILRRQYAELYPAFDEAGVVVPGAGIGQLSVEALLAVVDRALATEARARELGTQDTTAARVALAAIRSEQGRTKESLAVLTEAWRRARSPVVGAALAPVLVTAARGVEAAAIYETLLTSWPKHADQETWRYEAARLRLEANDPASAPEARRQIEALASGAKSLRVRLRSRLSLAERLRIEGDEAGADKLLKGLDAQAGAGERAPAAWTARMLFRLGGVEARPDAVMIARAERHVRMLMRTFPESFEAQQVKHAMLGMLRQMAQMPHPPMPGK